MTGPIDMLRSLMEVAEEWTDASASEKLRFLGKKLDEAHAQLVSVYDELGADYESDAAKQFELQLQHETDPEKTYDSWWVTNDRENIHHPKVGGKLPNDGKNWPWIITHCRESVQPGVRQAAELLGETRNASEQLATLSRDDLELLADIPTTLGKGIDALAAASSSMEQAMNHIGEIRNDLKASSWEGDGRDAYKEELGEQLEAFEDCQEAAEDNIKAAIALADLVADLAASFAGVRQKQVKAVASLADAIFLQVNPGNWLDVAQKIHKQITTLEEQHASEFAKSLEALADSAENENLVESAERTAGMVWPTPERKIEDGAWTGSSQS